MEEEPEASEPEKIIAEESTSTEPQKKENVTASRPTDTDV
jgi:hypothetical protein